MTQVAVLGAGSGGLAAAADLTLRGYSVRLYTRSGGRVAALENQGGIRTSGVLGNALAELSAATTSLEEATDGAQAIVVVLPALAHESVGRALAPLLDDTVPVVLNPGHMCGSVLMRRVLERSNKRPSIAEFGTLTYVCRSMHPASVEVYLRAERVPYATSPPDDALTRMAGELFPGGTHTQEPLEVWLWDVNMVLHPPGMILGASRIEATGGNFAYYGAGVTNSVTRLMRALDAERIAVGRAYGADVPALERAMASLGTADSAAAEAGDVGGAVRGGAANSTIKAPANLDHRYLHEDVAFGLVPLAVLGSIAGVTTPVADATITLAETITGRDYRGTGLNAAALGLVDADPARVLAVSKGEA